jgi:hypothetical protein
MIPDELYIIPDENCMIPDDLYIIPDENCMIPDELCMIADEIKRPVLFIFVRF